MNEQESEAFARSYWNGVSYARDLVLRLTQCSLKALLHKDSDSYKCGLQDAFDIIDNYMHPKQSVKEQTMSEQKEKTALELVDELDRYLTGGPLGCHDPTATSLARSIKAAIERERDAMMADIQRLQAAISQNQAEFDRTIQEMNDRLKSAVVMRPISELPDKVPDGCMVVVVSATCLWPFGNSELIKNLRYVAENFKASRPTHFYILPLPKPALRLHRCYMPQCKGEVAAKYHTDCWRVVCSKCGMLGPTFDTQEEAEKEWGTE